MKHILIQLLFLLLASTLTAQCAYTSFRYEPDYDGCGIRFIDKSEGKDARTWDFGNSFIPSSIKK